MRQAQYSLTDQITTLNSLAKEKNISDLQSSDTVKQLEKLYILANTNGLYDAADHVKSKIKKRCC